MPVYICDMENLSTSIYNDENGHWVVQKTTTKNDSKQYPLIKYNALVKGSCGAIGLMQNPIAPRK